MSFGINRLASTGMCRAVDTMVWVVGVLVATPVVLFVRLIAPFVLVRFSKLRSDVIGHMIFDSAFYLASREYSGYSSLDLFFFTKTTYPNSFAKKLIERHLWVGRFWRYCYTANELLPGGEVHSFSVVGNDSGDDVDRYGIFNNTIAALEFTEQEDKRGRSFLADMGLDATDKFVCLVNRDPAYKTRFQSHIKADWEYHSYRNSSIDSYALAVEALVERGYWVFRMGKCADERLAVESPRVVDYPFCDYVSDFLDIWLMANAFFTVSSGTGLDTVSTVYRRPVVYVDYVPIGFIVSYNRTITLPKRLVWDGARKSLSLKESLKNSLQRSEYYQQNGILVEECTAEAKKAAVLEMELRLNERWETSNEEAQLNERFWSEMKSWERFNQYHGTIHPDARLASVFLHENAESYLPGG